MDPRGGCAFADGYPSEYTLRSFLTSGEGSYHRCWWRKIHMGRTEGRFSGVRCGVNPLYYLTGREQDPSSFGNEVKWVKAQ